MPVLDLVAARLDRAVGAAHARQQRQRAAMRKHAGVAQRPRDRRKRRAGANLEIERTARQRQRLAGTTTCRPARRPPARAASSTDNRTATRDLRMRVVRRRCRAVVPMATRAVRERSADYNGPMIASTPRAPARHRDRTACPTTAARRSRLHADRDHGGHRDPRRAGRARRAERALAHRRCAQRRREERSRARSGRR